MPNSRIHIDVKGLDEMHDGFKQASLPKPTKSLRKVDTLFDAAAAAVASRVHVDTGRLKLSGRHHTHYFADMWIGEITYRSHPGIFELAREDTPTRFHPEGGHFFFSAADVFVPHIGEAIDSIFDDYFGV